MKRIYDSDGPMILREDCRLEGVVGGDVTVPSGLRIEIEANGEIRGGLLLCAGSHARIHGVVHGSLRDEGGSYELFGRVGSVRSRGVRRYA